jgi:hypothetical protein
LRCEDESFASVTIPLPDEVNVIDVNKLSGIGGCTSLGQFRGVIEFRMPDTGFLFSLISQRSLQFQETFLGYNVGDNDFIDCADFVNDYDNDPAAAAPELCPPVPCALCLGGATTRP